MAANFFCPSVHFQNICTQQVHALRVLPSLPRNVVYLKKLFLHNLLKRTQVGTFYIYNFIRQQ